MDKHTDRTMPITMIGRPEFYHRAETLILKDDDPLPANTLPSSNFLLIGHCGITPNWELSCGSNDVFLVGSYASSSSYDDENRRLREMLYEARRDLEVLRRTQALPTSDVLVLTPQSHERTQVKVGRAKSARFNFIEDD
jgi:hypothetical protein